METIYMGILVFLFLLAVFDLMVGVSNDAVNFLSSAVGSRTATLRVILAVAAVGIVLGAASSNGMMEIARSGIFHPEYFTFRDVMCLYLAVMVTDVLLLDLFNSLGLPTSTTVSLVFELLGGAFLLAILKSLSADFGLSFADMLNTEKALSVIIAIFVSVAVAFVAGTLVQYVTRLLFTFRYARKLNYLSGVFGGIAVTAIIYFMIFKGMKSASFMTPALKEMFQTHTALLVTGCFVVSGILMQLLHYLKVNVLRIVVLLGTFALAMAFAGNDLVNFIGVPLAGLAAFTDFSAASVQPDELFMGSLSQPARTPLIFLLLAGAIMVYSLCTSKKARNVIRTSVDLSRQDEGEEMFGSSAAARGLVRVSVTTAEWLERIIPERVRCYIAARFDNRTTEVLPGAAFDQLRAAVNLILAALLIALGTSLKLPLSTTYVTFMVAMGTSLADRAWGRESAVFRITGVLSVIGGWFLTAAAAFSACMVVTLLMYYGGALAMVAFIVLTAWLLLRSNRRFRRKQQMLEAETTYNRLRVCTDKDEAWSLLRRYTAEQVEEYLAFACDTYELQTRSFLAETRSGLVQADRRLRDEKNELRLMRRREMAALRRIDPRMAMEKNTWMHLQSNSCEQVFYALRRMNDACREHVDNKFPPLPARYGEEFMPIRAQLVDLLREAARFVAAGGHDTDAPADISALYAKGLHMKRLLPTVRDRHLSRIASETGSLKGATVYLQLLQESQEVVEGLRHLLRAYGHFMGRT